MMSYDTIISEECSRPRSVFDSSDWYGNFWTREYTWFGLRVVLHQWRGSRQQHEKTGKRVAVSLPRFWWFLWKLRQEWRVAKAMPSAKVVRR